MTTRLAPWQRINIALARGLLLKASGKMKWMANIDVHGVEHSECCGVFPIEADSEYEAAQNAATNFAMAYYGLSGERSFAVETAPRTFIINIGVYQGNGLTKGRSLTVRVERYEGEQ